MKDRFFPVASVCVLLAGIIPFLPVYRIIPAGAPPFLTAVLATLPVQLLLLGATLIPSFCFRKPVPVRIPDKNDLRIIWYVLPVFLGITLINGGTEALFRLLGLPVMDQGVVQFAMTCSIPVFLFLAIVTIILAPAAEELAFRYTIYGFLRENLCGSVLSAVIASLLFALLHALLQQTVGLFILGMILQRAAETDEGRITRPILLHSLYNGCGILSIAVMRILN